MDRLIHGTGMFEYRNMIEQIDDLWLFFGGEQVEGVVAPFTRNDSKLDEESAFPKYSVYHALDYLMSRNKLRSVKLNFHHDLILKLPWTKCLKNLGCLDLGIRVTNEFLDAILSDVDASGLKILKLQRAEISDSCLMKIAASFPLLTTIEIRVTPVSKRGRYRLMTDNSASLEITDDGMRSLLQSCKKLKHVHVAPLQISTLPYIEGLSSEIKSLSVTLSASQGLTMDALGGILLNLGNLDCLKVYRSPIELSTISDLIVNEEDILKIASLASLKNLVFFGLDLCKNESNIYSYYGISTSTWKYDEFQARFHTLYPSTRLESRSVTW